MATPIGWQVAAVWQIDFGNSVCFRWSAKSALLLNDLRAFIHPKLGGARACYFTVQPETIEPRG
jgi:hypothetical protein